MQDIATKLKESPFFTIEEFVHPYFIHAVGKDRAFSYVSDFQVNYAFLLREILNTPVILNTWHRKKPSDKGYYIGRGTRPATYLPPGGGTISMHYFANALDCSTLKYSPKEIYDAILANREKFELIGLTTIENILITPGWLHGDCRRKIKGWHPDTGFLIVG